MPGVLEKYTGKESHRIRSHRSYTDMELWHMADISTLLSCSALVVENVNLDSNTKEIAAFFAHSKEE